MRWRVVWRRHNGRSGGSGRSCPKGRQLESLNLIEGDCTVFAFDYVLVDDWTVGFLAGEVFPYET